MNSQNVSGHFNEGILPDDDNTEFSNDARHHDRFERSGGEFGDLFQTLLDPENHDTTMNGNMYLPPFLERTDFQQISDDYPHHDKQNTLNDHDEHGRSASMHSVNPEEVFQSPSLLPRKHDEGMPSSIGSAANSSLFSTPLDDTFTPLISPITTPLEVTRNGPLPPEFSMPSAYMNSDLSRPSNSSRKSSVSSRRAGSGKSTPTMTASNSRVSKVNSPVLRTTAKRKSSQPNISNQSQYSQGSQGSSSDSVSPPDQLDDIVMPPPSVISTGSDIRQKAAASAPATPASLMNMPANTSANPPFMTLAEERVQSALAATNNASSQIRRSSSSTSMASSPVITNPQLLRPKLASTSNWKAQKNSMRSPAIKPKISNSPAISPNIAPKKSNRASDSGDLVEMLASKSNYQNIIEGNHSQLGLEYPENLSVGLVSKKTSHKIAEQGRRNRINNALTELAQLVSPAAAVNSKASTVESAILLIKDLQTQLSEAKTKLQEYEENVKEE